MAFGRSLTRELGKNTGKWVSNKVFGDGHSTPVKLIRAREREKARKESEEARRYKYQQRQIETDRRERERAHKERLKQAAREEKEALEREKQALIASNNKEVEEHNNYIDVIQSVHKDFSDKVNWEDMENLPYPEYIETAEELKNYYRKYTDKQVEEKISEVEKEYKLSFARHIVGKYLNTKNRWLFKLTGNKRFMWAGVIMGLIIMFNAGALGDFWFPFFIFLSYLLIVFAFVLYKGGKDFSKKIKLKERIVELEKQRSNWYQEYLKEQEFAHHEYIEDLKEVKALRKIAKGVKEADGQSYIYAINLLKPFEDLEEYGSDISFELIDDNNLLVNFYAHSESVIPNTIKKTIRKGAELKEVEMPVSRFNEIYQDYVCSCILRIAKEVFQLLPLNKVAINANGQILNSATGNMEEQTIISVEIEKAILENLNFDLLDPSDSMQNFKHNMKFKKTAGFLEVKALYEG